MRRDALRVFFQRVVVAALRTLALAYAAEAARRA